MPRSSVPAMCGRSPSRPTRTRRLLSFANWQCGYVGQMLRAARKEYGDHARYIRWSLLLLLPPRRP